jgi:NAD-dependent SIR2 family protein deacetylase
MSQNNDGTARPTEAPSRSSASSTSTQWPSAPSSPDAQVQNVTRLQEILDRALHDPFSSFPDTAAPLKFDVEDACRRAAEVIFDADVLLVITGAGFSADSGLATYIDVADVDAYRDRGWRYRDLCVPPTFEDFSRFIIDGGGSGASIAPPNSTGGQGRPKLSPIGNIKEMGDTECNDESDGANGGENKNDDEPYPDIHHPQYFYGFWNQCCNDYRKVNPHEGYDIIARWGKDKNFNSDRDAVIKGNLMANDCKGIESNVAREIRTITRLLEVDDSDGSVTTRKNLTEEPYYVSPTERPGAFFIFTSNVDAHCYDVFHSHEIRECHGNVELWQCHNFACGTNATLDDGGLLDGMDCTPAASAAAGRGVVGGSGGDKQKWERRLWRLPLRHEFLVDCKTMSAPYSKSLGTTMETSTVAEAEASSSSLPSRKRRKTSPRGECRTSNTKPPSETSAGSHDRNDVNPDVDTAAALNGIMEDALRNHLEMNVNSNGHVGQVHGKKRLFPLRHMNPPPTDITNEIGDATTQDYFLPISDDENWPICPRCHEAARPAVLMFDDLNWVHNSKQARRWQRWCESLLILSKRRYREADGDIESDSSSALSVSNMSENGWEDVSEAEGSEPSVENKANQTPMEGNDPRREGDTDPVDSGKERCGPGGQEGRRAASTSTSTDPSQQRSAPSPHTPQSSSNEPSSRLKVAILEIGCGYNVPTCRRTAEILLLKLSMRGADASLIRINLSHPEPDDDDIEDSVISIMEKGFVALKLIDARYRELVELNSSSQISNDEKSDANDARNFHDSSTAKDIPLRGLSRGEV